MKSLTQKGMKLVSDLVFANAKKEANSACAFIGYQPKMPKIVKELGKKHG